MDWKRQRKLDRFDSRVDRSTLVPLGLLRNFWGKHLILFSGLFIQVEHCKVTASWDTGTDVALRCQRLAYFKVKAKQIYVRYKVSSLCCLCGVFYHLEFSQTGFSGDFRKAGKYEGFLLALSPKARWKKAEFTILSEFNTERKRFIDLPAYQSKLNFYLLSVWIVCTYQ